MRRRPLILLIWLVAAPMTLWFALSQGSLDIGILFQDPETAFPATVHETVMTGRYPHLDRWRWEGPEDYRAVEAALAAVGLPALAQRPLATPPEVSGGGSRSPRG